MRDPGDGVAGCACQWRESVRHPRHPRMGLQGWRRPGRCRGAGRWTLDRKRALWPWLRCSPDLAGQHRSAASGRGL
ncbi:hypothetical protein G6F59_018686 [Rhizopus arrhizus]|nr:hypothetical protein G6F59_018686 [Rhizopus arrhizus]